MLEILLYIYLAGAVGTGTYVTVDCANQEKTTLAECVGGGAAVGALWPVTIGPVVAASAWH